jgi:hypothetical protein
VTFLFIISNGQLLALPSFEGVYQKLFTGEIPQARSSHRDDDAQVASPVGEEEDQDGGAPGYG